MAKPFSHIKDITTLSLTWDDRIKMILYTSGAPWRWVCWQMLARLPWRLRAVFLTMALLCLVREPCLKQSVSSRPQGLIPSLIENINIERPEHLFSSNKWDLFSPKYISLADTISYFITPLCRCQSGVVLAPTCWHVFYYFSVPKGDILKVVCINSTGLPRRSQAIRIWLNTTSVCSHVNPHSILVMLAGRGRYNTIRPNDPSQGTNAMSVWKS